MHPLLGKYDLVSTTVYTNYFYDTSVIFSNFIITYREPFTGPTYLHRSWPTDRCNWHRLAQKSESSSKVSKQTDWGGEKMFDEKMFDEKNVKFKTQVTKKYPFIRQKSPEFTQHAIWALSTAKRYRLQTAGCNRGAVLVWQQLSDRNRTFLRIFQSVLTIKFWHRHFQKGYLKSISKLLEKFLKFERKIKIIPSENIEKITQSVIDHQGIRATKRFKTSISK